jgi:glycosyltransferase involved in cell wall biosynthesis
MQTLSVVIPTLGGVCLTETLRALVTHSQPPDEILVCLPFDLVSQVSVLSHPTVHVIATPTYGQVAQRAYGLSLATGDFVLQLDDDVIFPRDQLATLKSELIKLGPQNVVCPVFRLAPNNLPIRFFNKGIVGIFANIYESLITGASWGLSKMGRFCPAGMAYWVDEEFCGQEPFQTDWLPGGCVLSFRSDLIVDDYYPFKGKSYSEDLIHSILRKRKGISHWVTPRAVCMIGPGVVHNDISSIMAAKRAHSYVVTMINGSQWRLRLWYFLFILKYKVRYFFKRLK